MTRIRTTCKGTTRFRRTLFRFLYASYLSLLICIAVGITLALRTDVPLGRQLTREDIWHLQYPQIRNSGLRGKALNASDGTFDILMLGASVLDQTEPVLREALDAYAGIHGYRLFNLCYPAHTTRDSFWKYSALAQHHFDLIIIYHGINDARMNCCPDEQFQADYRHCQHYDTFERRLSEGSVSPGLLLREELAAFIGLGKPRPENLQYGGRIKTANPFRSNLEFILTRAESRKTPVILMTFATYLPRNYTRTRFQNQSLDYGAGSISLPIELWGRPEDVLRAVDQHNQVLRELANHHSNVTLIDQCEMLLANGRIFSDPCHLTDQGIEQFVSHLMPVIGRLHSSFGDRLTSGE